MNMEECYCKFSMIIVSGFVKMRGYFIVDKFGFLISIFLMVEIGNYF